MPSLIPALLLLGLLPLAADALAQAAPTAAPIITRPIATDCDNNPFARSLETYAFTVSLAHPQIYQYTVSPRGSASPGVTHGNCYRWKIAAVNQNGAGPAATTQPILARPNDGRQGCPDGQAKPWTGRTNPYSAACTQHVEAGEWRHENGGDIETITALS